MKTFITIICILMLPTVVTAQALNGTLDEDATSVVEFSPSIISSSQSTLSTADVAQIATDAVKSTGNIGIKPLTNDTGEVRPVIQPQETGVDTLTETELEPEEEIKVETK